MRKIGLFFLFLSLFMNVDAQLSQVDKQQLSNAVKENLGRTVAEGAQMYTTRSGFSVLVVVSSGENYSEARSAAIDYATKYLTGTHSGALGLVKEIQTLTEFHSKDDILYYVHYLVVSKTSSKKGLAGAMSMVIPGSGQFYKGNIGKGTAFLSLAAASAASIIVCENTRSSYRAKAIEQPKYMKEYLSKANNWETSRNICIGVASGFYALNVIDAFFSKSASRKVVTTKNSDLSIQPTSSGSDFGVVFTYNF